MKFAKAVLTIFALLVPTILAACGENSSTDASSFPEGSPMRVIVEKGEFRVGVQSTYPLIGQQTLNGFSGFDIEVAKDIAEHLGLTNDDIRWVPVTTPTRETFVQQNKVDMVVAAYSITTEREKVIDFAGPYLEAPSAIMVRAGNPRGIREISDLVGKKLCVASGSNQEGVLRAQFPDVTNSLVTFDSSAKCRDAVLNGSVDASSTDVAILAAFVAESDGKLEIVGREKPYTSSGYGIGIKQESKPVFCEWINKQLAEMFDDGSWVEDYKKTLGTVLGDPPPPPKLGTCGHAAVE